MSIKLVLRGKRGQLARLVLAAALGRLSSASLVSWRGGTGSWLDQSAWDNGHPAYAQQVQVSGLASIVTLDDAAWTPAVVTLGASASLRAGSKCQALRRPGLRTAPVVAALPDPSHHFTVAQPAATISPRRPAAAAAAALAAAAASPSPPLAAAAAAAAVALTAAATVALAAAPSPSPPPPSPIPPLTIVNWRGGTGSWLDQSAWDNGSPRLRTAGAGFRTGLDRDSR